MSVDLRTRYLGLDLAHPIVAGASPLSNNLDGIRRLEDAGASAVVLPSLFEEAILHEEHLLDRHLATGEDAFAEVPSFFPEPQDTAVGPDVYLELIRSAKEAVRIPLIASLNGHTPGGWTSFAREIEAAGADALELNVFFLPTNHFDDPAVVEKRTLDIVRAVRAGVRIPLAVKMHPYWTATAYTADRIVAAGANGLVLFNRFYQPDLDLDRFEAVPTLHLSRTGDLLLPLRWTAILHGRIDADLALSGGVHFAADALKAVAAGADAVFLVSELLRNGLQRIVEIQGGMREWLAEKEYSSLHQLHGALSQQNLPNPEAFARSNYLRVLASWRDDPTGSLPG